MPPPSRDRARLDNTNAALNIGNPDRLPSYGVMVGQDKSTRGGRIDGQIYVMGRPTFTKNHDVYFYLWSANKCSGCGAGFFGNRPWRVKTNDINGRDGILPQNRQNGTNIYPAGCVDEKRPAIVIALDTGTGMAGNIGTVSTPCYLT